MLKTTTNQRKTEMSEFKLMVLTAIASGVILPSFADRTLNDGLVAYLPFDNSMTENAGFLELQVQQHTGLSRPEPQGLVRRQFHDNGEPRRAHRPEDDRKVGKPVYRHVGDEASGHDNVRPRRGDAGTRVQVQGRGCRSPPHEEQWPRHYRQVGSATDSCPLMSWCK